MRKITINIFKTIASILISPLIMIFLIIEGFTKIGSDFFDDIVKYLKIKN